MAIENDILKNEAGFNGSLIAENAYWKITLIHGNKEKIDLTITGYSKKPNNSDGMLDGSRVLIEKYYSFIPDLNGDNFIAQAYQHLKTLPEFANALDV